MTWPAVIDKDVSRDSNARLVYSTGGGPLRSPGKERQEQTRPAKPPPGIRIRLDRRASGRVVTVVTGVPGSKKVLAELARALRAACGAGGTVGKDSFELQGDHRDAVEAALRERGLASKRAGG